MAPLAPRHVCAQPGCTAIVPRGEARCLAHRYGDRKPFTGASRAADRSLEGLNGGYHSVAWRTLRAQWLKDFPLCVLCGGTAEVLDHVEAHRGSEALFWSPSNLQTLCQACHRKKTAKEIGARKGTHG